MSLPAGSPESVFSGQRGAWERGQGFTTIDKGSREVPSHGIGGARRRREVPLSGLTWPCPIGPLSGGS